MFIVTEYAALSKSKIRVEGFSKKKTSIAIFFICLYLISACRGESLKTYLARPKQYSDFRKLAKFRSN